MKRIDLNRYAPPGRERSQFLSCAWLWAAGAVLWSLRFIGNFIGALDRLYEAPRGMASYLSDRVLVPGRTIAPFMAIAEDCMNLFPVVWIFLLLEVAASYLYFRKDSMSIYLMRRLPDKWELHRRCWGRPLIFFLQSLALILCLTAFYFLIYLLFTPAGCLPY